MCFASEHTHENRTTTVKYSSRNRTIEMMINIALPECTGIGPLRNVHWAQCSAHGSVLLKIVDIVDSIHISFMAVWLAIIVQRTRVRLHRALMDFTSFRNCTIISVFCFPFFTRTNVLSRNAFWHIPHTHTHTQTINVYWTGEKWKIQITTKWTNSEDEIIIIQNDGVCTFTRTAYTVTRRWQQTLTISTHSFLIRCNMVAACVSVCVWCKHCSWYLRYFTFYDDR